MDPTAHTPQTPEERLVAKTLRATWLFYAVGALYVVGPVLAWVLFFMGLWRLYLGRDPNIQIQAAGLPLTVWAWILGMLAMEVALIVGHLDFGLGMGQTIKSSIGWAKGWALLALFIMAGAVLSIRAEVIWRGLCVVGLYTLIITPVLMAAYMAGLPERLFVSPLKAVGGPGPEFFAFQLYLIDPSDGSPRWQFYTPWAPAAGFMGNITAIGALAEKNPKWKAIGLIGALAMIMLSKSRLALVALVFVPVATWGLSRLLNPWILMLGAFVSTLGGLVATMALIVVEDAVQTFKSARADSTRVREALGRIAVQRWAEEAPIWGHGIVERGPHMVEYMPIGSHHSWYGLLFVKGIVGFLALLLPLGMTMLVLLVKAQRHPEVRPALSMTLILILYTFGENLEILAYLIWPALVVIGIALRSAFLTEQSRSKAAQAEA